MRFCKSCKVDLPEEAFYVSSQGWLSWKCKECCKAYGKAKRTRDRGRPSKHPFVVLDRVRYYLRESGYYISTTNKRLHRAIWEKQYGPIPQGHQVHHADGNARNNDLSNLEMVSHATHMKMHADLKIQQEFAAGIFDKRKLQRRLANRRYRLRKKLNSRLKS